MNCIMNVGSRIVYHLSVCLRIAMDKIYRCRKKKGPIGCEDLASLARQKWEVRAGTQLLLPGSRSFFTLPVEVVVRRALCCDAAMVVYCISLVRGKIWCRTTGECRQKERSRVSFDKWLDTRFLLKLCPPYLSLDSSVPRPPLHSLVLRTSLIVSVKFVCKRD